MKAIKQRFHQEIVRKYKYNFFAKVRKEILEAQQFHSQYNKILQNSENLSILIQKFGYVVFYKHISKVLDKKLYTKLYEDEIYFLSNLTFIDKLLQCQVLPVQQIDMLISGLSQILRKYQFKIPSQNLQEIFNIVQTILSNNIYLHSALNLIAKERLIHTLYKIVFIREMNEYFFKIINFSKIIGNENITNLSDAQQLRCLQIHILTSNVVEELYVSYSLLGDIFHKTYTPDQQLFQYGSVLDKTMKDIFIQRLIDPISYFIMKALTNHSISKLVIKMNFIQVIFKVINSILFNKSNVSLFGHQSIWCIFRKIIDTLIQYKKFETVLPLDWQQLREKLQNYHWIKYPYIKIQILQCLKSLSKTCLKNIFIDLISYYTYSVDQIQS